MRRWIAIALLSLPASSVGAAPPADVVSYVKSLHGKPLWLRIEVIRFQGVIGGIDATNVYADGMVRYQLRLGIRRTESTSAEEFLRDGQRTVQQNDTPGQFRVASAGTQVAVTMTKVEDKEIEVEFNDTGKSKHKIRLKFESGKYSLDDVKRLLAVCFADSKAEAMGKATITITLGMSVEEVIAAKGAPKTKVELGIKTILTYDDMKLVFENGKLTDVQ